METTFYSNGKLLLTGEYLVLNGAKALALPTVYGQNLTIEENNSSKISWQSFDSDQTAWISTELQSTDIINNSLDSLNSILKGIDIKNKNVYIDTFFCVKM